MASLAKKLVWLDGAFRRLLSANDFDLDIRMQRFYQRPGWLEGLLPKTRGMSSKGLLVPAKDDQQVTLQMNMQPQKHSFEQSLFFSIVQWLPFSLFFFGGCSTKMVFPKKVPFFSRVTEQLSLGGQPQKQSPLFSMKEKKKQQHLFGLHLSSGTQSTRLAGTRPGPFRAPGAWHARGASTQRSVGRGSSRNIATC